MLRLKGVNPSTDRFQGTSQGSHHWPDVSPGELETVMCEILGLLPQQPLQPCLHRGPHTAPEWDHGWSAVPAAHPHNQPWRDGLRCPVFSLVFIPGLVRATSAIQQTQGLSVVWGQALHQEQGIRARMRLAPSRSGCLLPSAGVGFTWEPLPPYSQMLRLCGDSSVFRFTL